MRMLYVRGGVIVNVVEYPNGAPETDDDCDVVPTVSGVENVGDAFDVTDVLRERRIGKLETFILQELFRLTNESRAQAIPAKTPLTGAQYRTFVKNQM